MKPQVDYFTKGRGVPANDVSRTVFMLPIDPSGNHPSEGKPRISRGLESAREPGHGESGHLGGPPGWSLNRPRRRGALSRALDPVNIWSRGPGRYASHRRGRGRPQLVANVRDSLMIGQPKADGGFERSIIKVTDPAKYSINPSDYFV